MVPSGNTLTSKEMLLKSCLWPCALERRLQDISEIGGTEAVVGGLFLSPCVAAILKY